MAVQPDLVGFVEARLGLRRSPHGPDSQSFADEDFLRNFWTIRAPIRVVCEMIELYTQWWTQMSTTLTSAKHRQHIVNTQIPSAPFRLLRSK